MTQDRIRYQQITLMLTLGTSIAGALMPGCAVGAEDVNVLMQCDVTDKFSTKHHLEVRTDVKGKANALTYKTLSKEGHECVVEAAQGRSFGERDSSDWTVKDNHVAVRVHEGSDIVANLTNSSNDSQSVIVEFQSISYEVFCGVRGFLATKIKVDRNRPNCTLF